MKQAVVIDSAPVQNSGTEIPSVPQAKNASVDEQTVVMATIREAFSLAGSLPRRDFAEWLCIWFENITPDLLIKWMCLKSETRIKAEKDLVNFLRNHTGMVIATRRIKRENRMSRNTNWARTLERASGFPVVLTYCNRVCSTKPNRFLYGSLRWLANRWRDELVRFEYAIPDADERLLELQKVEQIPVIQQSPMLPFSSCDLMKLYEMSDNDAHALVESLLEVRLLENRPCTLDDLNQLEAAVDRVNQKNHADGGSEQQEKKQNNINNLFELLIVVKSAAVLQSVGWKITDVTIDKLTSKPVIELSGEGTMDGFGCRISKGGIGKFDLSRVYRGWKSSGFEPDVVYIFYRKRDHGAVMFLGDAKYYTVSGHDGAVCGKLLNIFAFARALGLKLDPAGGKIRDFGSDAGLIQYHHTPDGIPIPSFMFFFPSLEHEKDERNLRNVMERFSLECFDCGKSSDRVCKYAGTGKCPGDVKKSFEHIFDLIGDENFVWPLHLDRDGNLEFNRTEQDMNDAGQ